jgi:hypothetical protein
VDAAGLKGPFTISHGLIQAPSINNVDCAFFDNGGDAMDFAGNVYCTAADAAHVTLYASIVTPSATSGGKTSVRVTSKIGNQYV